MEYVGGQVDAEYRVTMSWDFTAKLSRRQPESIEITQDDLGSVPLRGNWCLTIDSDGDDLVLRVKHGELPVGALGECVTVTLEFAYLDGKTLRQIATASWPAEIPQPKLGRKDLPTTNFKYSVSKRKLAQKEKLPHAIQKSIQQYRFSITFTQEPRKAPKPKPDLSKALANLSSAPNSTRDCPPVVER